MIRAPAIGRAGATLMLVTMIALAAAVVHADERAPSQAHGAAVAGDNVASTNGVSASVTRGPNGLEVEGRFRVAAAHDVAWAVLTDYDGIDLFVSSMRESRITQRGENFVMVEQVAVGGFLFFKRRLRTTLKVHEEPPGRIRFEDVLRKDFEHYEGEWRIEGLGPEVEVVYHVQARPAVSVPDFIARGMFERTARQLLSEIKKEIASRAAVATRQPSERSRQ